MQTASQPFLTDIKQIRARAREQIERGPLTDAYGLDLERVLKVLNEALATEIVCTLRYMAHAWACEGFRAEVAEAEFREHADQEWQHMQKIAARIAQLGGTPDMDPSTLVPRSHAEYTTSGDLEEMIREDLVAERVAVQTYQEVVRWLGDGDPTTRRMMEEILAQEEEHAEDMQSLLASFQQSNGAS